jgi:hypothetical protein
VQREGRIDYRMRRRAVLNEVRDGDVGAADVRDAHQELLRAGRHIGRVLDDPCPLCEDDGALRLVTYVFTGRAAKSRGEGGRAVPDEKLPATVARHGDLKAYEVEVCLACHWHHLLESYWLLRVNEAAG